MGSIISLLVILAVVAGIALVAFAAIRSVGSSPDKPWEGYTAPPKDQRPDSAGNPGTPDSLS